MKGDTIKYKEGYKYQLSEDYSVYVGIFLMQEIRTDYLTITINGVLHIHYNPIARCAYCCFGLC